MLQQRLLVHPRCTRLPLDLAEWRGLKNDPAKDGIDALRYIVLDMLDIKAVRQQKEAS
jgi:hypothetical protein